MIGGDGQQQLFEKALSLLADLQTNHELFLSAARAGGPQVHLTRCRSYLQRLGITQQDLSNLNIIHVSGTKGKGSVCAFAESILRHSGLVGFSFVHTFQAEFRHRPLNSGLAATQYF